MALKKDGDVMWVEAKNKAHFAWNRRDKKWVTGIDQKHLDNYLEIKEKIGIPIWLYFLHLDDRPSDGDLEHGSLEKCPTGLFVGEVDCLKEKCNYKRGPNNGKDLFYWAENDLEKIAEAKDFEQWRFPQIISLCRAISKTYRMLD